MTNTTKLTDEQQCEIDEIKWQFEESLIEDIELRKEELKEVISDLREEMKDDIKDMRRESKDELKEEIKMLMESWM